MSLKQIYLDAGVSHTIRVNQLWQSWPISMQKAQESGLQVRPVKIGSRRVLLATQHPSGRGFLFLPVLAIALVVSVCIFALIPRAKPSAPMLSQKPQTCIPIEVGTPITQQDNLYSSGDWLLRLKPVASSGNIEAFNFDATCHNEKISGAFIASMDSGVLRIKKIDPRK